MKDTLTGSMARRLATALLLLSMVLPVLPGIAAAAQPHPERLHPALAEMAKDQPNETVRVIVQGYSPNGDLSTAIDKDGGLGKKSLPLIKGYSFKVTAAQAQQLAKRPDVKWMTIDSPMRSTLRQDVSPPTNVGASGAASSGRSGAAGDGGSKASTTSPNVPKAKSSETVSTADLAEDYPLSINADKVWNGSGHYIGSGVTVAVLDSGFSGGINAAGKPLGYSDFRSRVNGLLNFNSASTNSMDVYGHGTFVAGVVGSDGRSSGGKYIGVAPNVNLLSVKVADDKGMAYVSEVINGLQWVIANKARYNIRVVNLSLVSTMPESYLTSPLDAAVEMAWLSGIVVVVSAGNQGANSVQYAPANDPFVITVGADDTNGTPDISDDSIPFWSSYGTTQDGFSKPEVVAPGRKIISNLASPDCTLAKLFPDRIVDKRFIRLSGTSMAAPMVSGVAALAVQAHPNWTPDQVKSVIMSTARPVSGDGAGKGIVDALGAVSATNPGYANQGLALNTGVAAIAGKTQYNSATWNSATWNSATWNSATWNSATWNSATWNSATWNSATWNSATWNSATWNSATWNNAYPD